MGNIVKVNCPLSSMLSRKLTDLHVPTTVLGSLQVSTYTCMLPLIYNVPNNIMHVLCNRNARFIIKDVETLTRT